MQLTLPLNARTLNRAQVVDINVVLPDYTTVGRPHGAVRLTTELLPNGNLAIDLVIHREDAQTIYARRFAYRPDELIHNPKTCRKED